MSIISVNSCPCHPLFQDLRDYLCTVEGQRVEAVRSHATVSHHANDATKFERSRFSSQHGSGVTIMGSGMTNPGGGWCILALLGILVAGCGAEVGEGATGRSACTLNSDCDFGALCLERECVVQCREDRDCPSGETCAARGCAPGDGVGGLDVTSPPEFDVGQDVGSDADSVGDAGLLADCDGGCPEGQACTWDGCQRWEDIEDYTPSPGEELRRQWEEVDDFGSGLERRRLPFGDTTPRYSFCGVQGYSNAGNETTARVAMSKYGLPYHCTEYALRFICEVYNVAECRTHGRNGQPTGHAGQWFGNHANHYVLRTLERHENGGTVRPQAGDILASSSGSFGHVAIVREVGSDYVAIIEQNVSQSEADAFRVLSMDTSGGRYRIAGWQGWMRVPGARPACSEPRPSLVGPPPAATFETGAPIDFRWSAGVQGVSHALRIRNLDTDRIVYDETVGLATSHTLSSLPAAAYRWTVYYRSDACVEPDDEGRCSADARSFTVVAGAQACDANACRARSATSGSVCDGNAVVSCGTQGGCEVETSRVLCGADQRCSASGAAAQCVSNCTANASRSCSGNAVYNYDSCGQRGSLVEQCSSQQTCSGDRCVSSSTASIQANYSSTLSPSGSCNPAESRAIYRGRASSISGNTATLVFEKCPAAGATIDAGRRWWVVVGGSAFPSEGDLPHYVMRVDGSVGSTSTRLTVSGVPIWPSQTAFSQAPCGDTRHLFLITDGGDRPLVRAWYQYRAITFTKTC